MSQSFDVSLQITSPVKWYHLPAEDAALVWRDLVPWVHWLVERFAIPATLLPSCWHTHPRIVEELTALWTAYEVMYDLTSPGSSPVSWLRELEWTLGRIRAATATTGCTPREHRPDRIETWTGDPDYHEQLGRSMDADYQRREEDLAALARARFSTGEEDETS